MFDTIPNAPRSRWSRWIFRFAIFTLFAVIAIWVVMLLGADEAAWATLLLFSPRALIAILPFLVLLLAAPIRSYRVAALGVVSLGVALGPIGGGTLSLGSIVAGESKEFRLRVVSLNCGVRLTKRELFDAFVQDTKPDIIALQEMPTEMKEWVAKWQVVHGSHGTAICSKYPIRPLPPLGEEVMGWNGGTAGAIIETPMAIVPFYSLHLITPRKGFEAVLSHKLQGLDDLRSIIRERDAASRSTRSWVGDPECAIIVGDFNMPVESRIYKRDWGGFLNAFSECGNGFGFTRHTERYGVRIDHILFTKPWAAHRAWVGAEVGSDHSPLVADLTLDVD